MLDVQYPNTPIGRRTLLRGAAVSSIAVLIAACGSGDTSPSLGADADGADDASQAQSSDDSLGGGAANGSGSTVAALDGEVVEVWRDPG